MVLKKHSKQLIFPIIILIVSITNSIAFKELMDIISILVSVIGILGIILYLKNKSSHVALFKFWIFIQFPQIWIETESILDNGELFIEHNSLFETAKTINFNIGASLKYSVGTIINVKINLLAILYFIIFKFTIVKALIGHGIKVSQINLQGKLSKYYPIYGVIEKRLQVENDNVWFLLSLNNPIILDDKKYDRAIINSKESDLRKRKTKKETDIRLIKKDDNIDNKTINKSNYPFIEWVLVELY